MALKSFRGNLERMFDKNLSDLVRGIRNNKENEAKYIAQCIEEIKQELRQENLSVKATAVAKLTYLQMLGYDMNWAGFNIIEVMSSSKFIYKRIGYLASSQCFNSDTELLMLTTNMIRKDLNSQNQYDAGLALSALSCFISPDLARDLANDIMTLLTSTKPYLRKKAVLMMYKVFLRFPEALRPAFPRLKEKLEDPDAGVQSAAVNVVCELARKNPKNYLSLAPIFFKLMTTSTNNWMLIKIIKLFGALTPLEPRLGKKLIEPLTNLIHSTSAMSLLYECINTVIAVLISISSGMPNHSASIQLCVQKLRILIEDSDQNLKYLGLLAMSKILKSHPKSVQSHKDLVLQCLDDKDESIRLRALDLLYGMVSKKTLMEIVKKLMIHMDKAEGTSYRDELLTKIVDICSQNNYQFITNFQWYISVLVDLTKMEGTQYGSLVATQMLDVAIRVQAIRNFAVQQMALLLENASLLTQPGSKMVDVLYAAAWICGEFANELVDPVSTLDAMLTGRGNTLPGHIQAVYVQNILKVFSILLSKASSKLTVKKHCDKVIDGLKQYICSADLEVQERASSATHLVITICDDIVTNDVEISLMAAEVNMLFVGELNPVAPKAQRKVQIPEGLDLDIWINNPPSSSSSSSEDGEEKKISFEADISLQGKQKEGRSNFICNDEDLHKVNEARKLEQAMNPHYLKSEHLTTDIPVAAIDLPIPLSIPGLSGSKKFDRHKKDERKNKRKRNKHKNNTSSSETDNIVIEVNRGKGEMPEGALDSDGKESLQSDDQHDPHKALDINLDEPLREEEKLPLPEHRFPLFTNSKLSNKKDMAEDDLEDFSVNNHKSKKNKKKLNKEDKVKKHKQSSSKRKKNKKTTADELVRFKDGYEEALGISTPSKETVCLSSQIKVTRLAYNKILALDYYLRPYNSDSNQILICLQCRNFCESTIRELEANISHSSDINIVNESGEIQHFIKLCCILNAGETKDNDLIIQVNDVTTCHKLRGTVSYIQQTTNGTCQEKLDFCITVGVTAFLSKSMPLGDSFTDLLSSGNLIHCSSISLKPIIPRDFNQILNLVSTQCHLRIIDQLDSAASLFSQSTSGNRICLLMKSKSSHISVEARSDSESLMASLLDEIMINFAT
uniref:AP-3 complex subunit delta n=2 Tax=Clastoptera arizonana TaxID=38151 RepID=A0A1B6DPB2_9HEMI